MFDSMFCLLQEGALFYKKSGLGALPLALFNGVPLNSDEMDPDELETILLQRIMDTTTAFQRAAFMVRHTFVPRETLIFSLPEFVFLQWRNIYIIHMHESG